MSPSTTPPFCSLTRTAWMVPLTRPQTVTFCAMMLPSTCAPSLIWRSEARTSPSIRPKTCAGPLHSMLPTIDMSEPMQEPVPAFIVGSGVACSTTERCGCTISLHDFGRICRRVLIFLGCLALEATQQHVRLLFCRHDGATLDRYLLIGQVFDAAPTLTCQQIEMCGRARRSWT